MARHRSATCHFLKADKKLGRNERKAGLPQRSAPD
jgi:hypothetical protein